MQKTKWPRDNEETVVKKGNMFSCARPRSAVRAISVGIHADLNKVSGFINPFYSLHHVYKLNWSGFLWRTFALAQLFRKQRRKCLSCAEVFHNTFCDFCHSVEAPDTHESCNWQRKPHQIEIWQGSTGKKCLQIYLADSRLPTSLQVSKNMWWEWDF